MSDFGIHAVFRIAKGITHKPNTLALLTVSSLGLLAAWTIVSKASVMLGANSVLADKDFDLNNKIQAQRDSYLHGLDNPKNPDLKGINICDQNQASQLVAVLNPITQNIWDRANPNIRVEMNNKGLVPSTFSSQNMPKLAADLAIWLKETGDSVVRYSKCEIEKDRCVIEKDKAIQSSFDCRDKLSVYTDKCNKDMISLIERKGECKDLEEVIRQNIRLAEVEKSCIRTKTESDAAKEKYNLLQAEYERMKRENDALKTENKALKNKNEEEHWLFGKRQ